MNVADRAAGRAHATGIVAARRVVAIVGTAAVVVTVIVVVANMMMTDSVVLECASLCRRGSGTRPPRPAPSRSFGFFFVPVSRCAESWGKMTNRDSRN